MKKIKAACLVMSLVTFLSLMSVASPNFAYYFGYQPQVGGSCVGGACPPATISGLGGGGRARVGSNGLDRYFNFLVAVGAYGLAPF